jgi:hypothetical protein
MPWSTDLEHDEKFCQKTHYFFQERVSLQNIKKSSKHTAFFSVEVWCFFLFPLGFGNVGQKLQKLRKNLSISSMLSAHCSSVLASNSLYKTKKKHVNGGP